MTVSPLFDPSGQLHGAVCLFTDLTAVQQLEEQFGAEEGRRIFDDLRTANHPGAPTTASTRFRYGGGPVDPTLPGVALPDLDTAADLDRLAAVLASG